MMELPTVAEWRRGDEIVRVEPDLDPEDPRTWDNLGVMICFHKRYLLGDDHDLELTEFGSWDELEEYLYEERGASVVLPLYLLDHSSLWISTYPFDNPWDSGQVGFIYTTDERIKECFKVDKVTDKLLAKARDILAEEVKIYNRYISGDVYAVYHIKVRTCDLGYKHEEIIDAYRGIWDIENDPKECLGINLDEWERAI